MGGPKVRQRRWQAARADLFLESSRFRCLSQPISRAVKATLWQVHRLWERSHVCICQQGKGLVPRNFREERNCGTLVALELQMLPWSAARHANCGRAVLEACGQYYWANSQPQPPHASGLRAARSACFRRTSWDAATSSQRGMRHVPHKAREERNFGALVAVVVQTLARSAECGCAVPEACRQHRWANSQPQFCSAGRNFFHSRVNTALVVAGFGGYSSVQASY